MKVADWTRTEVEAGQELFQSQSDRPVDDMAATTGLYYKK